MQLAGTLVRTTGELKLRFSGRDNGDPPRFGAIPFLLREVDGYEISGKLPGLHSVWTFLSTRLLDMNTLKCVAS